MIAHDFEQCVHASLILYARSVSAVLLSLTVEGQPGGYHPRQSPPNKLSGCIIIDIVGSDGNRL